MKKILIVLFFISSISLLGLETDGTLSLQYNIKKDSFKNFDQIYNMNLREEKWNLRVNNSRGKVTFGQEKGDIKYKEYYLTEIESNRKEGGVTLYYKNFANLQYVESSGSRKIDGKYQNGNYGGRLNYVKNKGETEEYSLYLNQSLSRDIKFYQNFSYKTDESYNIMLRSRLWWFTITTNKTEDRLSLEEKYKYNNFDKKIYIRIENYDDFKKGENLQELYISKGYKDFEFTYNYIENEISKKEISYDIDEKNRIRVSHNNLYYEIFYSYFDLNKDMTYSLKKSKEGWDNYLDFYYKKEIQENVNYKILGNTDLSSDYNLTNEIEFVF